jgi:hypothetical protein
MSNQIDNIVAVYQRNYLRYINYTADTYCVDIDNGSISSTELEQAQDITDYIKSFAFAAITKPMTSIVRRSLEIFSKETISKDDCAVIALWPKWYHTQLSFEHWDQLIAQLPESNHIGIISEYYPVEISQAMQIATFGNNSAWKFLTTNNQLVIAKIPKMFNAPTKLQHLLKSRDVAHRGAISITQPLQSALCLKLRINQHYPKTDSKPPYTRAQFDFL